ncbi:linoleate 13s-lipoxygenase 3-1 [Quercus suber]|uniref:Linoleate 13s-lipoxygenase 3-1 n=1 Tax=Quercus suber TaxID=58331 RepID=A0AAW0JNP9_QUESU
MTKPLTCDLNLANIIPCETPVGLKELRDEELRELRGDRKGLRMPSDKIYYYDVYNDLGDPVEGFEYMRPTLEGEKNPHPRCCCTRCPHTSTGFSTSKQIGSLHLRPTRISIREEHIKGHLNVMSVQKAIEENKLFILDYHDMYLPFLNQINSLDDQKAYGTRTIFFLTSMGTLKPIAIKLSLPPADPNSHSKQVLTPPVDATTNWLWQLGKAHVCSNDSSVHLLVHHWLCTHACMEPFIIAAHRHLSAMHPIYKFLDPCMRYTLKINALARESLINAGGIIETEFTPGKYCMQSSCAAYTEWWQFDLEGLPADLIRRGVAIPDPTQAHGIRLLIEDDPYATNGILIGSAIQTLVRSYVNYYYQDPSAVCSDTELQAWYNESINHVALNFGQYPYDGYIPTRPPLMRQLMPKEHDPEYTNFVKDLQGYFLSSLPSWSQITKYIAVVDIISSHSPDEEYLGMRKDLSTWSGDPEILKAFYRFSMEIRRIEKEIEKKNSDISLRNRCGARNSPYELLIPSSGPGVTCRGVPNSITV